ncbi:MAG: hypothetical protein SO168_05010 [Muribaculaceae bacterium]|nr:hypothetical protein [Bacteroidales bacterium]MDY4811404.1 hypothetical protein [Muribaculaceae bacterium]
MADSTSNKRFTSQATVATATAPEAPAAPEAISTPKGANPMTSFELASVKIPRGRTILTPSALDASGQPQRPAATASASATVSF